MQKSAGTFGLKTETDFGVTAKSDSRKEERGLRAQEQREFRGFGARAGKPCRPVQKRVLEKRNWSKQRAKNESAHEACNHNVRDGKRRASTLPSRAAWRADRRWPRLRGTAERVRTPERKRRRAGAPPDFLPNYPNRSKQSVAATAATRAAAKKASTD